MKGEKVQPAHTLQNGKEITVTMSIVERKVANVYLGLTFSWFNYEYGRNMSWKYNCNAYIIQRKG